MSYCRKGEDSDVYVVKSITGEWVCWSDHGEVAVRHPASMLVHLLSHKNAGDKVPDRALIRLRDDVKEYANG